MNLTEFSYLLNNPNNVSPTQITELNSILKVYPYFQSARSLYLKGLQKHDNIKYNTSLKKTAAYTTDRSILFDLITSEQFKTITKVVPKEEIIPNEEVGLPEIKSIETPQEEIFSENKLEQSLLNSIEIASLEGPKPIENNSIDLNNPLEQSIISSINAQNITDVAYQNHLSRLKYLDENPLTGRMGVYNMGRNFSVKVNVPLMFD